MSASRFLVQTGTYGVIILFSVCLFVCFSPAVSGAFVSLSNMLQIISQMLFIYCYSPSSCFSCTVKQPVCVCVGGMWARRRHVTEYYRGDHSHVHNMGQINNHNSPVACVCVLNLLLILSKMTPDHLSTGYFRILKIEGTKSHRTHALLRTTSLIKGVFILVCGKNGLAREGVAGGRKPRRENWFSD